MWEGPSFLVHQWKSIYQRSSGGRACTWDLMVPLDSIHIIGLLKHWMARKFWVPCVLFLLEFCWPATLISFSSKDLWSNWRPIVVKSYISHIFCVLINRPVNPSQMTSWFKFNFLGWIFINIIFCHSLMTYKSVTCKSGGIGPNNFINRKIKTQMLWIMVVTILVLRIFSQC